MPIIHEAASCAWEACAPTEFQGDPVWRFHPYRVALHVLDLASSDVRGLRARQTLFDHGEQLGELRRIVIGAQKWLATKSTSAHSY